jgi:hypothetical protein
MATTYYFSGATNSDWNTSTNWTPNGIPVSGDTAQFDNSSPNCSMSTNNACTVLDFSQGTGYGAQLTINSGYSLTVYGDLTLPVSTTGMTFFGGGQLRVGGGILTTQTLTSGGTIVSGVVFTLAGSGTPVLALADDWTVDSLYIGSGSFFYL